MSVSSSGGLSPGYAQILGAGALVLFPSPIYLFPVFKPARR
jgi:hypothetical protein